MGTVQLTHEEVFGSMKKVRVGINGFGRTGRCAFRAAMGRKDIEVVAVNSSKENKTLAHLLKYDSTYGKLKEAVSFEDGSFSTNGWKVQCFQSMDGNVPWEKAGVDVVLECSGKFKQKEQAQSHVRDGVKKVIAGYPMKTYDAMIALGVNEENYQSSQKIISMSSCTTNCLAPVVKVLHESFGLKQGYFSTIHAYTSDQRVLDKSHDDLRRARSAAMNIIPTDTGAAKNVGKLLPELAGKLDGVAFRVPVPDGSVVDLTTVLEREASVEEINQRMKKASEGKLKGILEYCEDPIVSSDIVGNAHSAVWDSLETKSMGTLAKTVAWYDNELAYSTRLIDLIEFMAKRGL